MKMKLLTYLSRMQGLYYFIMGIWPILDIDSFVSVTGPKTDIWLVRTAGALIAGIGLTFLVAQAIQKTDAAIVTLALTASFGLCVIDVLNSITGRIPVIYLADAFVQSFFFTAWAVSSIRFRKTRHSAHHTPAAVKHRH
jgi:hypothetical protein